MQTQMLEAVWSVMKQLAHVPLLDSWKDAVLQHLGRECCSPMHLSDYPPIGNVAACQVKLPLEWSVNSPRTQPPIFRHVSVPGI